MAHKLQVTISEEAQIKLADSLIEAQRGFSYGSISVSDMVEEAILSASFDLARVRHKKANLRKVILGALRSGTRNADELIEILGQYKGADASERKRSGKKSDAKNKEGGAT